MKVEYFTKERIRLIFMGLFFTVGFIVSEVGHKDWGAVCQVIGALHFKLSMIPRKVLDRLKSGGIRMTNYFGYFVLSVLIVSCFGEILRTGQIVLAPKIITSFSVIVFLGLTEILLLKKKTDCNVLVQKNK